nr:MAG TPA: hypothetical protein [Caudoviricetes sp.]
MLSNLFSLCYLLFYTSISIVVSIVILGVSYSSSPLIIYVSSIGSKFLLLLFNTGFLPNSFFIKFLLNSSISSSFCSGV